MSSNKNDKWNAQHYKQHSDAQFKRGTSVVYGVKFQGNESVLDVGCGDGRITAEIAKQVPEGCVVGVDASPNMVAEAQKCYGSIKNLNFICIDAANFSSDKKFDLAVSFAAFHWIKNQPEALKNIYRHLKPGGKLIIKTSAVYKSPVSDAHESEKWVSLLSSRPQTYFPQTVEGLSKLLENSGFQNIDVKQEVAARIFKDREELFNWAYAWVPHSTGLYEDKAHEFTQEIVDRVCASREDGQIILESALLDATAVK